jgi:DNA-binding protein HU-beta
LHFSYILYKFFYICDENISIKLDMKKGDLITSVGEQAELTKAQASDAVNAMLNTIALGLKEGDKITITGFGTFSVTKRPARMARNPKTGEMVKVGPKMAVKFRAGRDLKEFVK